MGWHVTTDSWGWLVIVQTGEWEITTVQALAPNDVPERKMDVPASAILCLYSGRKWRQVRPSFIVQSLAWTQNHSNADKLWWPRGKLYSPVTVEHDTYLCRYCLQMCSTPFLNWLCRYHWSHCLKHIMSFSKLISILSLQTLATAHFCSHLKINLQRHLCVSALATQAQLQQSSVVPDSIASLSCVSAGQDKITMSRRELKRLLLICRQ